jgi:hypothetical protein
VTENDRWEKAVAAVTREHAALSHSLRTWVGERAVAIREHKMALNAFSQGVSGGEICAACRGECCARGRHHFTVIDLLVHLASGRPLFTPDFAGDRCPWLGPAGCLMEPEYRPYNCVTFNCERVEGLQEPQACERFYTVEGELRALYGEVEELFGNRFMQGLLLSYERAAACGEGILLRRGGFPPEQTGVPA